MPAAFHLPRTELHAFAQVQPTRQAGQGGLPHEAGPRPRQRAFIGFRPTFVQGLGDDEVAQVLVGDRGTDEDEVDRLLDGDAAAEADPRAVGGKRGVEGLRCLAVAGGAERGFDRFGGELESIGQAADLRAARQSADRGQRGGEPAIDEDQPVVEVLRGEGRSIRGQARSHSSLRPV